MELYTEMQELKRTIKKKEKEQEKLQKEVDKLQQRLEIKKEEKQNQKEYEKGLHLATEKDLRNTFMSCFERDGLEKGYINLCLLQTRQEILKNVAESSVESEYIDNNYERILEKVKKIFENDQKAKSRLLQIELQEQLQKEKKETKITNILYMICNILFSPLTLVLLFIVLFIWGYFAFAIPILT